MGITTRVWYSFWVALGVVLFIMFLTHPPKAGADPNTPGPQPPGYSCTQTGQTYPTYRPCPGDVVGPLRGGGNHRWTDESDD